MRRITLLLCLLLTVTLAAACSPAGGGQNGPVSFQQIDVHDLPADVRAWAEALRQNGSKTFRNQTYLVAYAGERPNGGYRVVIDSVAAQDAKLSVSARVLPPEGPAIEVISYPVGVARISKFDGEVSFRVSEAQ